MPKYGTEFVKMRFARSGKGLLPRVLKVSFPITTKLFLVSLLNSCMSCLCRGHGIPVGVPNSPFSPLAKINLIIL
ncbi:hypothetical protein [Escherichia phage JN01]|uniref:Uncharacterized protein n=1 Tax=Escherichia phage JN01 TaxID=2692737 RepID=A0A6B9SP08_9CAUD|nr:hypothetical protein [Escherichia phage JN01]